MDPFRIYVRSKVCLLVTPNPISCMGKAAEGGSQLCDFGQVAYLL